MPRLGEILLAANVLTENELESALENHVLHGVKLGTCLVEMGLVSDDILARCLGKQTGYAFLTKDQLVADGAQNLSIISPAATKKYRLIPVGINGAALRIATDDHLSAKKQAGLEKFIGRRIEPVAVSGYAVDCFLEQIFGIPRPGRFLSRFSKTKTVVEPSPGVRTVKEEATSIVIDGVEWKLLGEESQDEESARSDDEIFYENLNRDNFPHTLSEAAEHLSRAKSRDDVAKTVLDFASNSTGSSALVIIKDGVVHGWKAALNKKNIPNFDAFAVLLATLPDLQQCVAMKKPYFGRCLTPDTELLWHTLRYAGGVVAYFPIFIQQRVAAVLLCAESEQLNPVEAAELCRKASYALEILILRSKLLG